MRRIEDNVGIAYIVVMATLNIRNLPDAIHRNLYVRAAKHGRSMEAEALEILTQACSADVVPADDVPHWLQEMWDAVDAYFGPDRPKNMVDELIAERREEARKEEGEYQEWLSSSTRRRSSP